MHARHFFFAEVVGVGYDPLSLNAATDDSGLPWATAHSLRRTVASDIDRAGLGVVIAADVLGHADPSMTARVYLGRKTDTSSAAKAL